MEQSHIRPSTGDQEPVFANDVVTVVASTTETATGQSATINARGFKGASFYLDVTAAGGTSPTLDLTIEVYDPVGDAWHAIPGAAFAQATAVSTQRLVVYPGVAETANVSVSDVLGRSYRFVWTIGGTTPTFTFSIVADYLR